MKVTELGLKGVLLIEPDVFRDARGFFLETYDARKYKELGIAAAFVQDNHSRSVRGTLRGLHGQSKYPQGKLVRAVSGEVFDVVVDARPDSPTFRQWRGTVLSGDNFRQVYIPPGFLHGFCVTGESAEVEYKCTDFYRPGDEFGVVWNDPELKIQWPLQEPLLSSKDRAFPLFRQTADKFEAYRRMN
jgi:dTDP-4-dehydrorhamnose 3,5-epimerase